MVNLDNLFFIIKEKGLSASKVSDDTGISTGNISDWKKGRSMPTATKLDILANYLDCSVDYLLGRTDNPTVSGNNIIQSSNVINGNNGNHSPLTVTETEKENNCKEIEVLLEKMPRSKQLRAIADIIDLLEEKYQEE